MSHYPKLTDEEAEKLAALQKQTSLQGTVRCACKQSFLINEVWRCFFCDVWYCNECAEEHFGMTKEQWREQKEDEEKRDAPERHNKGTPHSEDEI